LPGEPLGPPRVHVSEGQRLHGAMPRDVPRDDRADGPHSHLNDFHDVLLTMMIPPRCRSGESWRAGRGRPRDRTPRPAAARTLESIHDPPPGSPRRSAAELPSDTSAG